MRATNRIRLRGSITALLALLLFAGAYQIRGRTSMLVRPWHLEAYLNSLLADCRTAPGAWYFTPQFEEVAARAAEARRSIAEAERQWGVWRDYTPAVRELLAACLDAHSLRLRIWLRAAERRAKSQALLAGLQNELRRKNDNGRIWSRFELRNLDAERAESLAREAEYLYAAGEYESVVEKAVRAWAAWQRHTHKGDAEFARFEDPAQLGLWERQAADLLEWTRRSGRRAILVDKLGHRCLLLARGRIEKAYAADLGRNWYRRKVQALDASTPEGEYKVKSMKPAGKYGYALLLDYPNAEDRRRFLALQRQGAIPADAHIGGNIEIHGGGRGDQDWTDGCISLDDSDMRDLYRNAYVGMPVTIVGTCRLASALRESGAASR